MRRWLWRGGLAVGLAGLVAAVLVIGRERPPFEFLEGREAMRLPAWKVREGEQFKVQARIYVFRGDYAAVDKAARAELESKHFNAHTGRAWVIFEKKGLLGVPSDPKNGPWQFLMIQKDVRLDSRAAAEPARGWVTVEVYGPGESSGIWDRLRSLFGL
jgi:hypothetical protein